MDIVAVVEIVIQLAIYVCVVCDMENICACSVCRVVKVQVWVAAAAADASLPPTPRRHLGPLSCSKLEQINGKRRQLLLCRVADAASLK